MLQSASFSVLFLTVIMLRIACKCIVSYDHSVSLAAWSKLPLSLFTQLTLIGA